jgi:DNA-binding beta-propeller fold protein YncE
MQALGGWHAWSLGLSPDGSEVYAVSDTGRIAGLDTATARVISTFDTGVGRPMAIMRVASA